MTRIDFRPWAGLALSVAVLGYVGCSSSSPTSSSPASPTKGESAGAGSKGSPSDGAGGSDSKLLANLGNPAAVLVLTGEMDGYLEPCGCTDGQIGGLLRRYDFFERLRKQNWPVASIDLGSLTKDPAVARGGFEQAKYKFDYSIKALKLLDYSAVALSAEDMKVGVAEALALFLSSLGDKTKIVVANVPAPAGFESMFQTSMVVPAGPVKVGVTAVIDPKALESLNDPDKGLVTEKLKRPSDVLPGVLAELEPKSDYQVLMVQGPPALAKSLAEAYPGFDIVVATSEYLDPLKPDPEMLNGGKTMLVTVGHRGKKVGVFGFYPGESERQRYYPVTLGTRYDGPATAMKKLIEDDYRNFLRQMQVVENIPRRDYVSSVSGATFVGVNNCKSCHPNTYLKWSTTKHAQAFEALRGARPQAEREIRRRMRHLPHDRVRVQHGLCVGGEDARPEGQPVRELPRPRVEAHRRARQPGLPQGDGPDPRAGREEPPLPGLPRRRQLAALRDGQVLRPDRPQGPRRLQGPQGPPRHHAQDGADGRG